MHLSPYLIAYQKPTVGCVEPSLDTLEAIVKHHSASTRYADSHLLQLPMRVKSSRMGRQHAGNVVDTLDVKRDVSISLQRNQIASVITQGSELQANDFSHLKCLSYGNLNTVRNCLQRMRPYFV